MSESKNNLSKNILEEDNELKSKINRDDVGIAKIGYIEIYPKDLATRGLFYNDGFRIFIRAAQGKEVKHWSTINEDDPIAVDEALNYIFSSCVEVHLGHKMLGTYKDVCQEDRLQLILMIRDLTYVEPESRIQIEVECVTESCGKIKIDLNSNNVKVNTIDETLMSRYSNEEKAFVLKTKSFGEVILKSPTIGLIESSTKIVKEFRQSGKKYDPIFVSLLPYLVNKAPTKDELRKLEVDFQEWNSNPKKISFYISIIEQMKFLSQKRGFVDLECKCDKCGQEVSAPLTFPNGLKSLFIVQDWTSELL